MAQHKFCPECNIGLNNREIKMRFCENCKSHWDEHDEPNEYDALDADDFEECPGCDGHDACTDFGCAIDHGLGHLVKKDFENL